MWVMTVRGSFQLDPLTDFTTANEKFSMEEAAPSASTFVPKYCPSFRALFTELISVHRRWVTRMHAVECVRRLLFCLSVDERHTSLVLSRQAPKGEYLVTRLADLVSLAFNAVSIAAAPARVAGLQLLVDVLKVRFVVSDFALA